MADSPSAHPDQRTRLMPPDGVNERVPVNAADPDVPPAPTVPAMSTTAPRGASLSPSGPPRIGMLATVRNRRGLVSAVEPFDGSTEGRFHLVTVEYLDGGSPQEDHLIWEREPGARLLEPTALPDVERDAAMAPDEFDALVRAARWTALSPYIGLDGLDGPNPGVEWSNSKESPALCPLTAPFHSAVQIEDFQLVPLLKALRMPRVALLLADDVGLGKTIEAGMILRELLTRRRVRRVIVLCPASLRLQWKQEMQDKFALPFDIVDRASTHALQKRLGMDANPWRTFQRIITSYDYLKQPDVLEQFRSACRVPEGSPHLPWDLLIVDEAHNLAPAPLGEESDLTRMLRVLAPYFEHKLFLTATPHNGHTRSFTGLLECLDPARFTGKGEPLTEADKRRVSQVVVRRLKSEINARTSPPKFCERKLVALPLLLSREEQALSQAFAAFRLKVRSLVASARRTEQVAGSFAVEVLGKRLLSCPVAFADSWHRYCEGLADAQPADVDEVQAARRSVREETGDDMEAEARGAHAARTVGAWLKPFAERLEPEIKAIDRALRDLGLDVTDSPAGDRAAEMTPRSDARFDALCGLIANSLRGHPDERLVVFTEYKTTLEYIARRLEAVYPEEGSVRVLLGGMDEGERELIKAAFNDPADPVRVLIATDAAAEGLNLQETARYILHYDVPWNPARLEQRNGRLDRHGQARDVVVYHFTTDDDADLAFLAYVIRKVHTIREDLGSTGQVFDSAIERRLIAGDDADRVRAELDGQLALAKGRAELPSAGDEVESGANGLAYLRQLANEVDLDADSLRETLDMALGLRAGRPRLDGPDERGRFRLRAPIPAEWNALVDDSLRLDRGRFGLRASPKGALPAIFFDASKLVREVGGRPIFRPEKDSVLLHLGHPLVSRALITLAQARFPGATGRATRWTVKRGPVPAGADALVLLTVEELAVNELRETFHHWVRTLRMPVFRGSIGELLPHVPARDLRIACGPPAPEDVDRARQVWDEIASDVQALVRDLATRLTERLASTLDAERVSALRIENDRFLSRQGEISDLIKNATIARLEKEIEQLKRDRNQGVLYDQDRRLEEIERSIAEKEAEIRRHCAHYEELRQQLQRERERVLKYTIPKRYTLRGRASVFPVAVEIRLPGDGR